MSDLDRLNLELGFQEWAEPRGFNLATDESGKFTSIETNAAWMGYEAAHGPAGCGPSGQQLYAYIKRNSDYAHQSDKLFPVRVGSAEQTGYSVYGGPGGVYRLSDVDFYVIEDGKQYRLS